MSHPTTGGKDEPNIKTYNRTTQQTKRISNKDPTKKMNADQIFI